MKRLGWLLTLVGLAACGSDAAAPQGPEWPQYASVAWEYRYTEPGYSEGLDSVVGALLFERLGDTARVRSETNVTGYFWAEAGADTARGAGLLWKPGFVLQGIVTPGDTFTFTSANYDLWPAYGEYRLVGDTLFYEQAGSSDVSTFTLRVRYQKQ